MYLCSTVAARKKLTFYPPAAPGLGRFAQNARLNIKALNLAFCANRPSRGPVDEQNVSFFPGDAFVDAFILTRSRFAPCYVHYRCAVATLVVGMLFMGFVRWLTMITDCLLIVAFYFLSPYFLEVNIAC